MKSGKDRAYRVIYLAASLGLLIASQSVHAAEPTGRAFAAEEIYVVDGVPIVLRQVPGEATVQVGADLQRAEAGTLAAPNGARFDKVQERGIAIYKLQSDDPPTEAPSQGGDRFAQPGPNVRLAYPVYADLFPVRVFS